jgi:uncharacterized protein (TIGR00299 family) protein
MKRKRSALQGLHLHFDPLSGIAGDMTVAALVNAGVPAAVVTDAIKAMKVPGLKARFEPRQRGAYAGTGFVVTWPGMKRKGKAKPSRPDEHPLVFAHTHPHAHEHAHPHEPGHEHAHDHHHAHEHEHHAHEHEHHHAHEHGHEHEPELEHGHAHEHDHEHDHEHEHDGAHRDHAEIQRLLRRSALSADTKALAGEIFSRIAEVEAHLHGVPVARVAFHEVGAFDSIADVVGAAAAIAWLEPSSISSTPPVLGTGTVWTAHGRVAVPAPATAGLLRDLPVRVEGEGELTTPTGAAILAAVVDDFRELPPMVLRGQGFGAGTRELADRANVLRVTLGEPVGVPLPASATAVRLLQANLDDMSPQLVEPLMAALFAAGALDAWVTPISMKKGRPALEVSALGDPAKVGELSRAFFENSTTLGVRHTAYDRVVLGRSAAQVATRFGRVPVKVAALDGRVLGATPEFDDCRRLAARAGVPVREVLAEASAAARKFVGPAAIASVRSPTRKPARKKRS